MITDRQHLETITTDTVNLVVAVAKHWLTEDSDAHAPRAHGSNRSSNAASDPTAAIAATDVRTRHRDHIGSKLLHVYRVLADLAAELEPRQPDRLCVCCGRHMATHGRDHKGRPVSCWGCDRYLSKNGYRCDDETHDYMAPAPRMCDCPDWCCPQDDSGHTSCGDRAADGRRYSERCKKRMQRDRHRKAS